MKLFARRLTAGSQAMAFYQVFRERKDELQRFIDEQMCQWGNWDNIPDNVKSFIDREFVLLGRFGKRIDIVSLEKVMDREQD